jgi:hypothetical protein
MAEPLHEIAGRSVCRKFAIINNAALAAPYIAALAAPNIAKKEWIAAG